jgi:hypothetical protein
MTNNTDNTNPDNTDKGGSSNQRVTNVKLKSQIESVQKDVRTVAVDVSALRADLAAVLTYKEVNEERWESHHREHGSRTTQSRIETGVATALAMLVGIFGERP